MVDVIHTTTDAKQVLGGKMRTIRKKMEGSKVNKGSTVL